MFSFRNFFIVKKVSLNYIRSYTRTHHYFSFSFNLSDSLSLFSKLKLKSLVFISHTITQKLLWLEPFWKKKEHLLKVYFYNKFLSHNVDSTRKQKSRWWRGEREEVDHHFSWQKKKICVQFFLRIFWFCSILMVVVVLSSSNQ